MQAATFESRPDLELNETVRAFSPSSELLDVGIDEEALNRVVQAASPVEIRAVVVDLGSTEFLSSSAVGDLLTLQRQLSRYPCLLVLLAEHPTLRTFFKDTELTRHVALVGSRAELTERLQAATAGGMTPTKHAMGCRVDALEDVGCADSTILDHCRQEQLHVRGCWLIAAILGWQ